MLTKKHLDRFFQKFPICNSMRTRPEVVGPEVYFRIVHVAPNGHHGAPVAAYREQTVEIALGPKGPFENGNIGAMRLRAPPGQGVSAVRPDRGNPKPAKVPKTPRVVELLRKTIEWKGLLESRKMASQAVIARQEGITRARVTQVMGMLRLAPDIQEKILTSPHSIHRRPVTERMLRLGRHYLALAVGQLERRDYGLPQMLACLRNGLPWCRQSGTLCPERGIHRCLREIRE